MKGLKTLKGNLSLLFIATLIAACQFDNDLSTSGNFGERPYKVRSSPTSQITTKTSSLKDAIADQTQKSEIYIHGFSLKNSLSEVVLKFGNDYTKIRYGEAERYFWHSPNHYLFVDALGEKLLRVTSDQAEIDGQKIKATETTPDFLIQKIGEPTHRFYGQHGEPCFSWDHGFQASFYREQIYFRTFSDFSLSTDPNIYYNDPFGKPLPRISDSD